MRLRTDWTTGLEAWRRFTKKHPELGYRNGFQQFHNFLRNNRDVLVEHDAIRRAKNKFWVAHVNRFNAIAFELATGRLP
jgi:hypothetical protein